MGKLTSIYLTTCLRASQVPEQAQAGALERPASAPLPEGAEGPPVGGQLEFRGAFVLPAAASDCTTSTDKQRNPFDDMTGSWAGDNSTSERFRRDDSAQETGGEAKLVCPFFSLSFLRWLWLLVT